jgi:hypothetical protein
MILSTFAFIFSCGHMGEMGWDYSRQEPNRTEPRQAAPHGSNLNRSRVHVFACRPADTHPLCSLDLGDLCGGVDADLGAEHLDLVGIHRRVGNEDARLLDALGLVDADFLVHDVALVEVRVRQRPPELLDDVDHLDVGAALEAQHGVDGEVGKVVLVLVHNLRAQRRPRNVDQVRPERRRIPAVVDRQVCSAMRASIVSIEHGTPPRHRLASPRRPSAGLRLTCLSTRRVRTA